MNLKVIITFYLLIWVIESYAQHKSFDVLAYYSGRNEITVEFMNFRSEEMVLLLDRGSFIKFYKVDEQHQLDKLMKYELVATDSMNILAKITNGKAYFVKYKVNASDYQKVFLKMQYSYHFTSPPADCEWINFTETLKIPSNNKRTDLSANKLTIKEQISGEPVYDKLKTMPEFPGGEQALLYYLAEKTSKYSSSHEQAYLRIRVVIEKNGDITHPYFIVDNNPLGKNPFFRKAALEIIKKMPKWKPGLKNGKAVRSYYTIPIMFKLK